MRSTLINKLCCPLDKHDLELKVFVKDDKDEVKEGLLTCSFCKRYYPIVYGIPILSPDEYREPSLELPLMKKWEKQIGGEVKGFYLQEGS